MEPASTDLTHINKEETAVYNEMLPLIRPQEHSTNLGKLISDLQGKWKNDFTIGQADTLKIKCSQNAKLEANELRDIITDIANLAQGYKIQDIDNLSWDFSSCNQLKENHLKELALGIVSHFKRLHKLSLNFSDCQLTSTDSDPVEELVSVLSQNLQYLQQFSLYLTNCPVKDETVNKLTSHISQHLKTLVQLALDFKYCGNITNKAAVHLVSEISAKLENLWRLTLDFGNNKLSEGAFQKVCLTVSKGFSKLEQLSLGFSGSAWMDDGEFIQGVTEITESLPNLKELSLDFYNCPGITEVGIKDLDTIILEHFDHLQRLSLNFGRNTKITEQVVIQLSFNIVHNLKELQHLSLGFREILTSESAIKIFSDISEYHPNLQELSLDFAYCRVNDEALKEITGHLTQHLKNLRRLGLNLRNNNITDDGLQHFTSELAQHRKDIKGLTLNLIGCENVANDAELHITKSLHFIPDVDIKSHGFHKH